MTAGTFSFYQLQTREEALARLAVFSRLPAEEVALDEAHGRVLTADLTSSEDLPAFARSTVDGYAVRARDTFGVTESMPGSFELAGEVAMGHPAAVRVAAGQTVRVWTGGMLPEGADAVVMLEYARTLDGGSLELTRPIAPGGNVISAGEDFARGSLVIPAGTRLGPPEVGVLAALGITRVDVVRRPCVAVLATGNEVVPATAAPRPGEIRDVNSHTLVASLAELGASVVLLGIVPDDPARVREEVERGLATADVVLVSGGSSVGAADWTLRTFLSFENAELLVHGVAIAPGKPLIVVRVGEKCLIGLPGHVASTLITFHLFVRPLLLKRLLGMPAAATRSVTARLSRNVASTPGRETWIRVRLAGTPPRYEAVPVLGPSGLISSLVRADGLLRVPMGTEGLVAGSEVEVELV